MTWAKQRTGFRGLGEGVEGGGLHFDREDALTPGGFDGGVGFAEGRVGGPGGAALDALDVSPAAESAGAIAATSAGSA